MKSLLHSAVVGLTLLVTGCVSSPPANIANICAIFEDRRGWFKAARQTEDRWGIPVPVSMAFIYQESRFQARAKPPRSRFLWVFPGRRPSTAFGYAQALDSTWNQYRTESGNRGARRDDFADAVDFVGWYNAMSRRLNRISSHDAANLYFAYHEGNGGYAQGRHRNKPWLLDTGYRVQANADRFAEQYASCEKDLSKNWFQRLFT